MANAIGALILRYQIEFLPRAQQTESSPPGKLVRPFTGIEKDHGRGSLEETLRVRLQGNVFYTDLPACHIQPWSG